MTVEEPFNTVSVDLIGPSMVDFGSLGTIEDGLKSSVYDDGAVEADHVKESNERVDLSSVTDVRGELGRVTGGISGRLFKSRLSADPAGCFTWP